MPMSSCRAAPRSLTSTLLEAATMGPTPGCGQAGQPWASWSTCALSPRRAAAGIVHAPSGVRTDFTMRTPGREAAGRAPAENGLRRVAPGVYGSRPMYGVIIAVQVLVSLLQPGRADGMAAFGGGGGASSVFGGRGSVTFLAKVTEVCAAIFMITSLTLAYRSSHTDSVLRARRNIAAQEAVEKQGPPPAQQPAKGGATKPPPPAKPGPTRK